MLGHRCLRRPPAAEFLARLALPTSNATEVMLVRPQLGNGFLLLGETVLVNMCILEHVLTANPVLNQLCLFRLICSP
jgi:hypothetical protein